MKRVILVRAATLGLLNPSFTRQPTNMLLLEIGPFPSMREGSVLWLKKSLTDVPSVDSDPAQTQKSDSVPKLCEEWKCPKECRPLR